MGYAARSLILRQRTSASLDALYEMADRGLLGLQPNRAGIDQIKTEVLDHAINAFGAIERDEEDTVTASQYFEG